MLAPAPNLLAAETILEDSQAARELIGLLRQQKYIRTRQKAEKLLSQQPDSVIGRFALARVFHVEEANLPRALYHLRLAEKQLLKKYGAQPATPEAQHWHRRILLELETLLGEMDRRHDQLATISRHDKLYKPPAKSRRVWPLMKLHRFKEAAAIARESILSSELSRRVAGYNGLLSIEFERERPEACYKVAMEAVRATGERSCILNLNTAEAAFAVFKFDEVERLALKSIQAPIRDCPSSAHAHLANLYLLRADFRRAISAVKEAREQGVPRRLRQQFEMSNNAWLMRLLYSLGQFDKSLTLAERVVRAPDRVGLISYSSDLIKTIHTVDYYAALQSRIEQLKEAASARPLFSRFKLWAKAQRLAFRAWTTRRKAAKLLGHEMRIVSLLRPYIKPMPSWHLPTLAQVAGSGIVEAALQAATSASSNPTKASGYFAAIEGEIAYRRGDFEAALQFAKKALAGLPKDEVLLRGRVSAWTASAAYQRGDLAAARRNFDAVLHAWPTALRIQGVALPTKVTAKPSPLAQRIAERLAHSRRLDDDPDGLGFVAHVDQTARSVQVCLNGPKGRRYACSSTPVTDKATADESEFIAGVIDEFHNTVFAPLVDLTQQDINSLDGSAVRARASDVLREAFAQ